MRSGGISARSVGSPRIITGIGLKILVHRITLAEWSAGVRVGSAIRVGVAGGDDGATGSAAAGLISRTGLLKLGGYRVGTRGGCGAGMIAGVSIKILVDRVSLAIGSSDVGVRSAISIAVAGDRGTASVAANLVSRAGGLQLSRAGIGAGRA